jgi:hypothetical protein
MKDPMPVLLGTAIVSLALLGTTCAESLPPGQVDFGKFVPPGGGGEFVEVNLGSSLLSLAATFVQEEEPGVAQLLNGLQLVRVNVIGVNGDNRAELEKRTQKLRQELENKGWDRVVAAQKQDQDVGIYVKTQGKEIVQGLVVTVMEGNHQAVFVNIVGNIKPEQLALLGERLHIEPLKKLGSATGKAEK